MKWLSSTIKKIYMDQILSGEKTSEYKGDIKHWNDRISNLEENLTYDRNSPNQKMIYNAHDIGINLLCGRKSYKFEVEAIIKHLYATVIDGVKYESYWQIKLGERILEE